MSETQPLLRGSKPASSSLYPTHDLTQFPSALRGRRILLCTESFGPVNGVSRTTLMLVNHLRAHGAQVAVVAPHNHTKHNTFSPPASPSVAAADALQQHEVRVTGYPLPFNPELSIVYPVRNSTLYKKTYGLDAPPDLIYLASPASLGFQVMLQLRQQPKERQVPIICNFQTDLAGYCQILFPSPLNYFAVYLFGAVQSFLFRHISVKTIFYPSQFVRRYLSSQKVQDGKMELLQRGVNTEMFNPGRRSAELRRQIAPNGEIILCTVSRIAGEKGYDFLALAAKELKRRNLDFKLYIVGGNRNPAVMEEIRDLFQPLVDQGTVIFAGFKTGEDLATAYASADIFLHPSITETFGLVVLEAMASGIPVIARDEGGPSDIVKHGKTGFLVEKDDLDTFCDKVEILSGDRNLQQMMATEAINEIGQWSWEAVGNKVAWRMADVIAEREDELSKMPPSPFLTPLSPTSSVPGSPALTPLDGPSMDKNNNLVPQYGWLMLSGAVREILMKRMVDARLVGGLGVILTFWAVTGWYVVFVECLLWSREKMRRGSFSGILS